MLTSRPFPTFVCMRIVLLVALAGLICPGARAQTLGGSSVFNFLKLSNTPQLTGLGGINISNQTDDIGLVFNNPALLRPSMNGNASFVFNSFYAGIKNYHLMTGYYHEKWETNFAFGVNYFAYGSIPETDMAGNILGNFRPVDYVVQVSAGRQYKGDGTMVLPLNLFIAVMATTALRGWLWMQA